MKLSRIGRFGSALLVSVAVGLGMTACGGGTVGYMWVLGGTQNAAAGALTGQIAGFKIDNYTGNLTSAVRSPFASGGTNPTSIVVKSGGRFVYVVNTGTPSGPAVSCNNKAAGYDPGLISVFSVGGDGTLTFQNSQASQGCNPVWAATDSTGGFLYVLDQKSPAYGTITNGVTDLNGDITVFAIDPNTGRLSLVTNAQIKNANGTQLTYFEVGPNPNMLRVGAGCVYTVDQGDHTIFPYASGSSGQLTLTTNSLFQVTGGAQMPNLTSINLNGSNVYLTDAANNQIIPLTVGSNCALNSAPGGAQPNYPGTANPVYSFSVTASSNTYLYVLNQSATSTLVPNSSISAFVVTPDNHLTNVAGGNDTNNPYTVGSGPVCAAIDPTNQYIYISDGADGAVTGKLINVKTGQLSSLTRGSTFPAVGKASCLAISPNVQ